VHRDIEPGLTDRIREEISDPGRKPAYVHDLFSRIAGRYDLTNDVMSLGLHRRWKRKVLDLADIRPGHTVLDLAAGTGDLALSAAARVGSAGLVVAGDLTVGMMRVGQERQDSRDQVAWTGCDAHQLPYRDATFDSVLIGYGLRNFADLEASLAEILRCLRPGGSLVALDFAKPRVAALRRGYLAYLDGSTRLVGWLLHRDVEAYAYIPESLRQYPAQQGVTERMQRAGFVRCGYIELLFGTMAINFGQREAPQNGP
jgi:demethylmenaquinone methyltransferase/2-methoxy-6-polyprenyl-1,4-benzoquinol methylase